MTDGGPAGDEGWRSPSGIELGMAERFPETLAPMLATATDRPFSHPAWLFEPKFDGYRCVAFVAGGSARLRSRNNKPFDAAYPTIAAALAAWRGPDVVLDGEVVAFEDGRPSFGALQQGTSEVQYFVFDVLHIDGRSTRSLPLAQRRILLNELPPFRSPVTIGPVVVGSGESLYEELASRGWEGMVAKRGDSRYHDRRSKDWLKVKHLLEQELVICGYTPPSSGGRTGFGALLLAYYDGDDLVYAGKVGTGFRETLLQELGARLRSIEIDSCPLDRGTHGERHPHWVRPELVAQVGFAEWTSDGRLRHPRFVGLRADKSAQDVRRE